MISKTRAPLCFYKSESEAVEIPKNAIIVPLGKAIYHERKRPRDSWTHYWEQPFLTPSGVLFMVTEANPPDFYVEPIDQINEPDP